MIGSFVLVLLGAAVAGTPCEDLKMLKLSNATITGADLVPRPSAPASSCGVRKPRTACLSAYPFFYTFIAFVQFFRRGSREKNAVNCVNFVRAN
jgi:hypothetical protein